MNSALNIARLLVICKEVQGRKKLQKIVHILQCAGHGRDFPQQFGYLHYGPYSHEVKADIDLLVEPDRSLVQEEESIAGLSHRTYVYRPKPELEKALLKLPAASWERLARDLNQRSAQDLEAISTVLYLKRSGVGDQQLPERFKSLKPALAERLSSAMKFASSPAFSS